MIRIALLLLITVLIAAIPLHAQEPYTPTHDERIKAICRRAGLVGLRLVQARDRGTILKQVLYEIRHPPTPEQPLGKVLAEGLAPMVLGSSRYRPI
jgi:hypothetical protein